MQNGVRLWWSVLLAHASACKKANVHVHLLTYKAHMLKPCYLSEDSNFYILTSSQKTKKKTKTSRLFSLVLYFYWQLFFRKLTDFGSCTDIAKKKLKDNFGDVCESEVILKVLWRHKS